MLAELSDASGCYNKRKELFFVLLVHSIQGQRDTQGRRLLSENVVREVNERVGSISFDSGHKENNIFITSEASRGSLFHK